METQLMEPEKCEGWRWFSFGDMRDMDQTSNMDLFLPMKNLMAQRLAICEALEDGSTP